MTSTEENFACDQLTAAQKFAHTMILVDDEAAFDKQRQPETTTDLEEPTRKTQRAGRKNSLGKRGSSGSDYSHPLDSKEVLSSAMDLGLICSIVQPGKSEDVVQRVSKASERADIVSLDWQIHGDKGNIAKKIIKSIIESDAENGGRLRLIAVYTGVREKEKILSEIRDALPKKTIKDYGVKIDGDCIKSDRGLRIVWLLKGNGIKISEMTGNAQVSESELPERLQKEFGELSEGLLSNIALATIASVRDATHHVLGKFKGYMDGPYFHHRAFIENPDDAIDYAVSVVLSELKSAVDKHNIVTDIANSEAIKRRLQHMAGSEKILSLKFIGKEKEEKNDIALDKIIDIVTKGWKSVNSNGLPGIKKVKPAFSSVFRETYKDGRSDMMEFASLTGVHSHSDSDLHGNKPKLGLGSIIKNDKNGQYLLCLQASCDTIRANKNSRFYFVPLEHNNCNFDHVVPVSRSKDKTEFQGLKIVNKAYTNSISIAFSRAPDSSEGIVSADKKKGKRGHFFKDSGGNYYQWIANLKQRRAMRSVQQVIGDMSRIGFDEFEPFRPGARSS